MQSIDDALAMVIYQNERLQYLNFAWTMHELKKLVAALLYFRKLDKTRAPEICG